MKKKSLSRLAASAAVVALTLAASVTSVRAGNAPDLDGDGIPNVVDPDIDNDGIPNALDRNVDGGVCRSGPFAGQYIGDHLDNGSPAELDIDNDGQDDNALGELDIDGDGNRDDSMLEDDIDGDGRKDDSPAEMDEDGDGANDDADAEDDIDGDGFCDDDDAESDIDGDGRDDKSDDDIDGDDRMNADSTEDDTDGDGRKNTADDEDDDDGDGIMDRDDDDDDNDGITDDNDADHHNESDEQEVQVSLTRVAAPGGSRCRVKIRQMATGKLKFSMDARDIPAGAYDVVIDGVHQGTLLLVAHSSDTEGEQKWETGADPGEDELPLTFDVIGRPVSLMQNGVVYFSGTVPTPPPPPDPGLPPVPGYGDLIQGPAAPAGAQGGVSVEFGTGGLKELEVEVEGIPAGDYSLAIGDSPHGIITVTDGRGKLRFDTHPDIAGGELLLDFIAAGLPVTISQGADVFFTGTIPPAPPAVGDGDDGSNDHDGAALVSALARGAGVPAGAKAEVQIQFGAAGATSLEVEIEDAADGDYEVEIGGTARGTVSVSAARGSLRFETSPESGELPLDFLAAGLPVVVRLGASVVFSGTVPVAPGS